MSTKAGAVGCLGENTMQELLAATLAGHRLEATHAHLDRCRACRELFSELARAMPTPATLAAMPTGTGDAHDALDPGGVRHTLDGADGDDGSSGALAPGTRVGRFIVGQPLGAGGMGVVHAADDPVLGRRVAVKLIRGAHVSGPAREQWQARLLREARAVARLSHPNVITVHDVGLAGDRLFMAMELVEGITLRRWLAAARWPWREVMAVCVAAGQGLAAAHHAGLVHRDFKPDNVLIGRDGRVRVTDFGLAQAVGADGVLGVTAEVEAAAMLAASAETTPAKRGDRLTRSGALVGTPGYIAPELLRGAPADTASDQYSFCVTLEEALFRGVHAPAAGALGTRAIRAVIQRGLDPDPARRFASMEQLLAALDTAERRSRNRGRRVLTALGLGALAIGAASLRGEDRYGTPLDEPPPDRAALLVQPIPAIAAPGEHPCLGIGASIGTGRFLHADLRANADYLCLRADGTVALQPPPYRFPFALAGRPSACDPATARYRTADFDGDHLDDLLVQCTTRTFAPVLAIYAVRGFTLIPLWRAAVTEARWCTGVTDTLLLADFDGDGRDDMLCHDRASGARVRWPSGPGASFDPAARRAEPAWCQRPGARVFAGDFNGDGRSDLLCHDNGTGYKHIDYATPGGVFGRISWDGNIQWCYHVGAGMVLGDFNGDGRTDLACFDGARYSWTRLTPPSGHIADDTWHGPTGGCITTRAADVDGDGRDEIVCMDGALLTVLAVRDDGRIVDPR